MKSYNQLIASIKLRKNHVLKIAHELMCNGCLDGYKCKDNRDLDSDLERCFLTSDECILVCKKINQGRGLYAPDENLTTTENLATTKDVMKHIISELL